jgi:hypothetical protein
MVLYPVQGIICLNLKMTSGHSRFGVCNKHVFANKPNYRTCGVLWIAVSDQDIHMGFDTFQHVLTIMEAVSNLESGIMLVGCSAPLPTDRDSRRT